MWFAMLALGIVGFAAMLGLLWLLSADPQDEGGRS
jgi:hypothetical protein